MTETRAMTAEDVDIVKWVLNEAIGWDPNRVLPPFEIVVAHPQLVVFHEDWGRSGDTGVVAEQGGSLVGAAFFRLFTQDRHGEGFIDEETPELGIAVAEGHRGTGLGTRLMTELADMARDAGIARLGLSVETANPAARLYARLGYREVERRDHDLLMVLDL